MCSPLLPNEKPAEPQRATKGNRRAIQQQGHIHLDEKNRSAPVDEESRILDLRLHGANATYAEMRKRVDAGRVLVDWARAGLADSRRKTLLEALGPRPHNLVTQVVAESRVKRKAVDVLVAYLRGRALRSQSRKSRVARMFAESGARSILNETARALLAEAEPGSNVPSELMAQLRSSMSFLETVTAETMTAWGTGSAPPTGANQEIAWKAAINLAVEVKHSIRTNKRTGDNKRALREKTAEGDVARSEETVVLLRTRALLQTAGAMLAEAESAYIVPSELMEQLQSRMSRLETATAEALTAWETGSALPTAANQETTWKEAIELAVEIKHSVSLRTNKETSDNERALQEKAATRAFQKKLVAARTRNARVAKELAELKYGNHSQASRTNDEAMLAHKQEGLSKRWEHYKMVKQLIHQEKGNSLTKEDVQTFLSKQAMACSGTKHECLKRIENYFSPANDTAVQAAEDRMARERSELEHLTELHRQRKNGERSRIAPPL